MRHLSRLETLEQKAERRTAVRSRKRKPTMKVSGASVKTLQRIIKKKANRPSAPR